MDSKNIRVLIGLVGIAVLALVIANVTGNLFVGLAILVIGVLAGVLVLRRLATGGASKRTGSTILLDRSPSTGPATRTPAKPGLSTWTPPESRAAWAPSTETPAPDTDEPELVEPMGDLWGEESAWDDGHDSGVTLERNPLDELESLEDVDVVAEVERIEYAEAPLEVGTTPDSLDAVHFEKHQVNEEVESADDIMAASQATELAVEPDNSELARLLAKVQARLAAYE